MLFRSLCLVDLADLTGYERDDSQGIMREWLRNANDACDARGDLVRLLSRGKLGQNHWGEPMHLADLIGKFKYVAGGVAEQRAREAFFCELGRGALLKLMREIRYPDYEKLIPGMVTYAAEGGAFMASYRDLFFCPLGY